VYAPLGSFRSDTVATRAPSAVCAGPAVTTFPVDERTSIPFEKTSTPWSNCSEIACGGFASRDP
jgi:hypothetical protein